MSGVGGRVLFPFGLVGASRSAPVQAKRRMLVIEQPQERRDQNSSQEESGKVETFRQVKIRLRTGNDCYLQISKGLSGRKARDLLQLSGNTMEPMGRNSKECFLTHRRKILCQLNPKLEGSLPVWRRSGGLCHWKFFGQRTGPGRKTFWTEITLGDPFSSKRVGVSERSEFQAEKVDKRNAGNPHTEHINSYSGITCPNIVNDHLNAKCAYAFSSVSLEQNYLFYCLRNSNI